MSLSEATLNALVAAHAERGERAFARWDALRFKQICGLRFSVTWKLWRGIKDAPEGEAILESYIRLCVELVGRGYCQGANIPSLFGGRPDPAHAPSFLVYAIVVLLPRWLIGASPTEQRRLMAEVWNLGEGLRDHRGWLDQFVLRHARSLERADAFTSDVIALLEPVLETPAPSVWAPPFQVHCVDAGRFCFDFLPGPLQLADARVVSVEDRLGSGRRLGVLLRPDGASEVLGWLPGPTRHHEDAGVDVSLEPDAARINGARVSLPLLGQPHTHIVCAAGFVVATAVDSQRLWIVEAQDAA